jgi:hypothetical protein
MVFFDKQVTPLVAALAYIDTVLVPVAVPLTVYEQLPVPEAVPAVSDHTKVDAGEPVAVNMMLVFWHTVEEDTLRVGFNGRETTEAVTVAALADWQVIVEPKSPEVSCAYAVTDLVPVVAPFTV